MTDKLLEYQFKSSDPYDYWPDWLKTAWTKKPSVVGAFYPGWGAADIRFFVMTHTGPQEVNDGDTLVYNPQTYEIVCVPTASASAPPIIVGSGAERVRV